MKLSLRVPDRRLNNSLDAIPKEQAEAVRLAVVEMVQEIADKATFKLCVAGLLNAKGIDWTDDDLDALAYVVSYRVG